MSPEREATYDPATCVAWCERCGKWTRLGQPYVHIGGGKFTHRLCAVRSAVPADQERNEQ